MMTTFPIPPGLTQADMEAPSTFLVDVGPVLTLYATTHELGGVYEPRRGFWRLWYPISMEDFQAATRAWLAEAGLLEQAKRVVARDHPPPQDINRH